MKNGSNTPCAMTQATPGYTWGGPRTVPDPPDPVTLAPDSRICPNPANLTIWDVPTTTLEVTYCNCFAREQAVGSEQV